MPTAFIAALLAVNTWQGGVSDAGSTQDQSLAALARALEDENVAAITDAVQAAKEKAGPIPVATVLINALRSKSPTVRTNAALALEGLPETAAKIVPVLTAALQDETASVRANAAGSLAGIARVAIRRNRETQKSRLFKRSVTPLAAALSDTDEYVRADAAGALGALGPLAKPAEPTLQKALKDDAELVRVNAASALWRVSENNKDLILPVLREGMTSRQSFVRVSSIWSLQQMGPAAAGAQKDLRRALDDEDEFVRRSAAAALGDIGPKASDAIPDLSKALKDKSEYVRIVAARAICRIDGDRSEPAIAALSRIMQDTDADFMLRIGALEIITQHASRRVAIRAIKQLLSKEDDRLVRAAATEALKKLQNRE